MTKQSDFFEIDQLERQREHEGIAVPEPVWQELAGVAKRFDVLLPLSL